MADRTHPPSVETLLSDAEMQRRFAGVPRARLVRAVRAAIAASRRSRDHGARNWAEETEAQLHAESGNAIRRVINATGVVLHTNLGRSPLAETAVQAVEQAAREYATIEFDLDSGSRGPRGAQCRKALARLAGAEDALVVNNAAGALLLAVNTVATGRPIAISRGELIEIGDSFRIPDILEQSGARLLEIGTTNRTHLRDYEAAVEAGAAALLIVHRSNFDQSGFVATPDPAEIVALAARHRLPVIHDIGSGLALSLEPWGLTGEPTIQGAVAGGATLVVASGDKLFGGPQAGLLLGNREAIHAVRRNPLARALRADKLTLAGLEATIALYDDPATARAEIPILRMLTSSNEELRERAGRLAAALAPLAPVELQAEESQVGGGSFPHATLPTMAVAVDPGTMGADAVALRLRLAPAPVIARIKSGKLLLDSRTISDRDIPAIAQALAAALGES